jgi:hypothetical protein
MGQFATEPSAGACSLRSCTLCSGLCARALSGFAATEGDAIAREAFFFPLLCLESTKSGVALRVLHALGGLDGFGIQSLLSTERALG